MPSSSIAARTKLPRKKQSLRITALVENLANQSHIIAEHGISLLIEFTRSENDFYRILFDTGQTGDTLIHNAKVLGLELFPLDAIVLSHGHSDHTGGLKHVVEELQRHSPSTGVIPVYHHPAALHPKYAGKEKKRSIGFPFTIEEFDNTPIVFQPILQATEILPDIWLSGEISRDHAFQPGKNLFIKTDPDTYKPDKLQDDMFLLPILQQGKVVITGCGHAGIINVMQTAEKIGTPKPIYSIIGGLHLRNLSVDMFSLLLEEIKKRKPQIIAPCHCCDLPSRQRLANAFPTEYRLLSAGDTIELPHPELSRDPLS